jgi:integrase
MSLHDLRKSCLSLHLTNGVDLLKVQKITRHKSARTTLSFYLAATPPDDHTDTGLRF